MKKAYIVIYKSSDGKNKSAVQGQLGVMGSLNPLTDSARQASWIVIPDVESDSANTIRSLLSTVISPFEEEVSVMRIDALDASDSERADCMHFLSGCKGDNGDGLRNFNRFSSRHEAFLQYQIEKPRWAYSDGIGMAIIVDFNDWCWLPIKEDGIYEKGKYDKYLKN